MLGPYNMALDVATNDLAIYYFVTTLPEHPVAMNYTYFMLPHHDVVHQATLDVITRFHWNDDKIGIIYDNHQGRCLHCTDVITLNNYRKFISHVTDLV